ncbi:MAG: PfkB family carbohydrate kinase [Candidatus Caldarchaeum sp.]|uniref:Uncharacterized protein n=1 Tax=Caldiarchaeum subterraneum TaxID=311458 RepID=A0A7C5LAL4_CALS0
MKVGVVGALTIDITLEDGRMIGGPPWYAGNAIHALGGDAMLYSAVGEDFPEDFLRKLETTGLDTSHIIRVKDAKTYSFKPFFKKGLRLLKLVSEGPPLPVYVLEDFDAEAAIVSPVFKEVGVNHVKQLRSRTQVLSVDLQGFLRQVDSDGLIFLRAFAANDLLRQADVIHCSGEEAVALTGCGNVLDAAMTLSKLGVKTCLIGVENGLVLIDERDISSIEVVKPVAASDATGAGDILTGSFTVLLSAGMSAMDAAVRALEVVARSLVNPPPERVPVNLEVTGRLCRVAWRRPRV